MDIQEQIHRQRVHHIVDSYQLYGDDGDAFAEYLAKLLETYPQALIELALVEVLIKEWSNIPMQKGLAFIFGVYRRLQVWQPETECLPPLSKSAKGAVHTPRADAVIAVTPVHVKADSPKSTSPKLIDTVLTPAQFEQITGLDAALIFDHHGQVWIGRPPEPHTSFEPPP
ncbi:hypothetical protein [Leptothoe kymatousa]|uniref:Uncharacterized protein n=1 Tax=Leptothoe kymatousa TAU-MAC 1615 TaxID=2364775 RepID=A0ABS5Y4E6_9CYAN|nr:hypothetical protein [Leptothoe kymatousa]MBT9312373.1 hypothetical protein [Leptothoe kymatousa TAU-MAC 1615]